VRDQHDGTGERAQRLLDHVERVDVEEVGGLVEQQHLGAAVDHRGEQEPAQLARRQGGQRLVELVGVEEVPGEGGLGLVDVHRHLGPEEVPHADVEVQVVVGLREQRRRGQCLVEQRPQQRGLAGAVDAGDEYPVTGPDLRVFGHQLAHRGRRCEGQAQHGTGLGLREPCGGLHLPALPRLGLARHLLGVPSLFVRAQPATDRAFDRLGLAPGAFDVLGEPGPRLLLRLEVQQQPLPAALFLDPVSGVVARVDQRFVVDAVELDDGGDHAVEERPVVRDDEQRAGEVGEVAAEPVEAGRVEVVRGFVEQEYRRLGEQHPGEHDPGLLTAGQGAETPAGIDPVDTQLCAYLVHPGGIRPPAELGEPVEVLGVGLLDGVGGIRLPGGLGGVGWLGGLGWLGGVGGFGEPEAAGKRGQLAWRARQVRADRGGRVGHLLGVVAERGGCVDGSLVRPQLAGQDAQQGRLAHAVRTDQADPVAPGQGQRHAPEQRLAVVGHRKIDSLKQGAHLRDIGWKDHRSCRGLPHRCLRSSGRGRCRGPCCRGRCISPTGLGGRRASKIS